MTDTIASLKRELKVLGPVNYSQATRDQREELLGHIAELEWAARTPEEIAAHDAHMVEVHAFCAARDAQVEAARKAEVDRLATNVGRDADRHAAKLARKALTTCGKASCPHNCNN